MSQLVVNLEGEVSSFGLTRITREKLYGRKKRVVVDDDGQECVSAMLTRDGTALLPPGTTGYMYVTGNYDVVERAQLSAIDDAGNLVESVGSTLGVEQSVSAPVDPTRILDHIVSAVYQLDPAEVGERLTSALGAGQVFEVRFNYRAGFDDSPAFVVQNEGGIFCLVCEEAITELLSRDVVVSDEVAEEDDPFADDLDFSMF
ncbi:MAG: hypothetical protein H0U74_00750 [Bradymonadaceae bacterium]|nr:hypothetical protein [Lujinxingiaceae bacterium]